MKHQKSLLATCCLLTALLAGCGNSNPAATTPAPNNNVNGVFTDAPVVGLSFSCGGQKAVTGTGGAFSCPPNSSVTFSVGGITLCTAPVQAVMTPVSCAQATDPTANTSTPSVLAEARFLMSISTTPASSGTFTITAAELQAATNLSVNFATATDATLQTIVSTVNPGATLVSAAAAQAQLSGTVVGALAGSYSGTYSGGSSGTFTVSISSGGTVTGTFADASGKSGTVSGSLVNGTTYSGTAGTATWVGNLDTSKTPHVFSGTWSNATDGTSGTFTGHN